MKVILTKDYSNLGRTNEVKEVKDGFALNFLIPQKIAVKATSDLLKVAAEQLTQVSQQVKVSKTAKEKWLETLRTAKVVLNGKANDQGHLYSQISAKMIQAKLKEQFGINLPDSSLKLVQPLKVLGEHVVQLRVDNNPINLKVKVNHE